jgi:hypothetical protein
MQPPGPTLLSIMILLIAVATALQVTFLDDPLLTSDTHAGVVHAVSVCMGDRVNDMFRALRGFVINESSWFESSNTLITRQHASEYYMIQFFNQYINDIETNVCEAVVKAVSTSRHRMHKNAGSLVPHAKTKIIAICRAHTEQLNPTDYYSSIDKIPMCMRRMINDVMVDVYSH